MNKLTQPRRLLLLSLPLLLALSGCKKKAGADDDAAGAEAVVAEVEVAHPSFGSISQQIEADATLAPIAQAAIQPKISAPVKAFYVQRGSHVAAGQLVATLENKDLQAAALDSRGAYTAAQGAYTLATQSTLQEDLTKARLDLEQARATLALDQSITKARQQLFSEGAIPGRDLDTAKATQLGAQAAYDIARQHLDTLEKSGQQATLETAQGNLESARGKLQAAQAQVSYTELRSPIRGVVTERPLFPGESAAAGTPVVTVMDTSALIAKLHIAQAQAQQLTLGAPATLTLAGAADPVPAKVSLISPALDPGSTTVEVWLRVENPKGALRPGSAAHAIIRGRTLIGALLVPSEAVQRAGEGEGKIVMVVAADGTAHKRPVTTGIENKDSTQILGGLKPGDTVITQGGFGLDDGTKVKVGAPGDKKDEAGADDAKDSGKDEKEGAGK